MRGLYISSALVFATATQFNSENSIKDRDHRIYKKHTTGPRAGEEKEITRAE